MDRIERLVEEYPRPRSLKWSEYLWILWERYDFHEDIPDPLPYDFGFIEGALYALGVTADEVFDIDEFATDGPVEWLDEEDDEDDEQVEEP